MSLSRQIVDRLPTRTVRAARRVAGVSGLQDVIVLERAIENLAEAVEENALLEAGLDRRVAELEATLLIVLVGRHEGQGSPDGEPASSPNAPA